ncbi:hypothetical protein NLM33_23660 [Bradyrhizobium sp. CCGUVB1N3]|nr:hypothetical protein [Bradyrhizobium sp. CCGUVB1N3]MCP3473315.1 hypothetical protein [Bradyrhizobium sp. CCGUVB1N3]
MSRINRASSAINIAALAQSGEGEAGDGAAEVSNSYNDIDVPVPLDDLKLADAVLAVAGAAACLDVELPAMPRADQMQIFGKAHAVIGAIFRNDFFRPVHQDAFADRTALVRTKVEKGVEPALGAKHTDLLLPMFDQGAIAFLQICGSPSKNFHPISSRAMPHADWRSIDLVGNENSSKAYENAEYAIPPRIAARQ